MTTTVWPAGPAGELQAWRQVLRARSAGRAVPGM